MIKLKSSKGFSLIELLIVIGLIGVLAAIASPYFTKFRYNTNLKEAVRTISGDIQLYKQSAVAENRRFRMVFNVGNNSYNVQREDPPQNSNNWSNVVTDKKVGAGNPGIKIIGDPTFASDTIFFSTRGTTTNGTVTIQHEKLLSEADIVVTTMGRARIDYDLK